MTEKINKSNFVFDDIKQLIEQAKSQVSLR